MASICVFCASSRSIDEVHVACARSVGEAIGRAGHTLVSGGGSVSMMGAVAQGARSVGARTVGVIPELLAGAEVADHACDELIVTPDMSSRKARMTELADAFIVLPGGIGTLEELFEVWVGASLGVHTAPVVMCDERGVFASLRAALDELATAGFIRESAMSHLVWTNSVEAAISAVEEGLGQ